MKFFPILLAVFSMSSQAWEVGRLQGEVRLKRNGNEVAVQVGTKVQLGDFIQTMKNSKVLLLEGKSKLWLAAKTRLRIDDSMGPSQANKILNLLYGKIRAQVRPKQAKKYRVQLKTAVAGVRGTEFFASVDDEKNLICTLEGSVEVKTEDGAKQIVNAGKGFRISPGFRSKLSDNSQFLVDLWVAQTSFEQTPPVQNNIYSMDVKKHKISSSYFYAGAYGWLFYCSSNQMDFNKNKGDDNINCMRAYLSPFLQFGPKNSLLIRPAIIYTQWSKGNQIIDTVPWKRGKDKTQVTLAEAYGQYQFKQTNFKLGIQKLHWSDGVLISGQNWGQEPTTYAALKLNREIRNWNLEFIASPGIREDKELTGYSPLKLLGLKGEMPKNWGSLYFLHVNYGKLATGLKPQYHGHELYNYGVFSQQRIHTFDYQFSSMYQKHSIHHDAAGMKGSVDANLMDLELGSALPTNFPLRFSIRYLRASENFTATGEDYYAVSMSRIVEQKSNLQQWKFQIENEFFPSHYFSLEHSLNTELNSSGLIRHLAVTKDGGDIGQETSLLYSHEFHRTIKIYIGAWSFQPGSDQAGKDAAWGYLSRAEFEY